MKFKHVLYVIATAYCLQGLTASGTRVRPGVIAVSPYQIPLGSVVEYHGQRWLAEDIGSGISWGRIDIWMESCRDAINWGRQRIRVKIYQ